MLVEADRVRKQDKSIETKADRLREHGNKAFQKGDYEKARDFYTQSLEVLEDYRAFANRSLCNLEIGKSIIRSEWCRDGCYPPQIVRWGEEANTDALKASRMNPTFPKAYYRMALGHAMGRDFPRAKLDVKRGLKHCPDNAALTNLLEELTGLGVPDRTSSPFGVAKKESRKVKSGAPHFTCVYCRDSMPFPVPRTCPCCAMSLETEIEEKVLIDFILNH